MKKIKVLRIISRLNIGGPAINTILLTAGLDKDKFNTLLIYGRSGIEEGDMLYYAKENNIEPIFIPELKRELSFLQDLITFIKIFRIVKRERPDIIHTHTAKAGALGRSAGILYNFLNIFTSKKVRLIHTFHGHIFNGYFNMTKTKIFILIERLLALFTSKIITVSETIKEELIYFRISNKNKIKVIPLGLDLDNFLSIKTENNGPDFNIGIVGRLVPIKNHRLFLESASKVIEDNPGMMIRFKIIGDGELRKELEDYSYRLKISDSIDFLGWQKELTNIYSTLDIVALTSLNEGTPLSLIEAMASARPVVVTNVGGVKDLLGDKNNSILVEGCGFEILERGIIVKSKNSNDFASALTFILKNSDLRKGLSINAREFVSNKFAKERLIKDIESLYNYLIKY
jgi:glycosyltransferase involved in cell wall biosynthesis